MVFRKLRSRVVAHIFFIISLATVVTFYFGLILHKSTVKEHVTTDVTIFTEIFEKVLAQSGLNEPDLLRNTLLEFINLPHLTEVSFLDTLGRVRLTAHVDSLFQPTDHHELGDFITSRDSVRLSTQTVDGFVEAILLKKLKNRGRCNSCHNPKRKILGVSLVKTRAENSFADQNSIILILCGITFVAIVTLSLATHVLFNRSVDGPIKDLKKAMDEMKKENFSYRIKNIPRDEISLLAKGMNEMGEKLQAARNELLELHNRELVKVESIAKVGELAAGMAHEIKNPISGIVFAANSILRETPADDSRREIFEEIVRQAHRVEQNLEALLTIARESRFERFPTNLKPMIERIILFVSQQDTKQLKTKSFIDENLPEILADSRQIEQVLMNLIINAIQAMSNRGQLTINVKFIEDEKNINIQISDTGKGIPADLKHKVFEPFFTTKDKGVGLGLFLCKEIINRHKGVIYFESEDGRGTTFIIELPVGSIAEL